MMKSRLKTKAKKRNRGGHILTANPKLSSMQSSPTHDSDLGLPPDLYAGIAGSDPETLAQARADRQRGFLAELRDKKREVLRAGNVAEAERIGTRIVKLRQFFEKTP